MIMSFNVTLNSSNEIRLNFTRQVKVYSISVLLNAIAGANNSVQIALSRTTGVNLTTQASLIFSRTVAGIINGRYFTRPNGLSEINYNDCIINFKKPIVCNSLFIGNNVTNSTSNYIVNLEYT